MLSSQQAAGLPAQAACRPRISTRGRLQCTSRLTALRDRVLAREQTVQEGNELLASQWHPSRNELSPQEVRLGSTKEIWWLCKCKDCGAPHEWTASPNRRHNLGNGCPVCAKARPCRCASLAALYPELVDQWDWAANGSLKPWEVGFSSHRGVRWLCTKHEPHHSWAATPKNRCRGSGCPICARAARCIKSQRPRLPDATPHLVAEFDPDLNPGLDPAKLTTGSGRKVWWKCKAGCSSCGRQHTWQAVISDRALRESNCPYCAGQRACACNSLAALHPALVAKQWDAIRNSPVKPQDLLPRSQRKVWWECKAHEPSFSWQAAPDTRTGPLQTGCPACASESQRRPRGSYAVKRPVRVSQQSGVAPAVVVQA